MTPPKLAALLFVKVLLLILNEESRPSYVAMHYPFMVTDITVKVVIYTSMRTQNQAGAAVIGKSRLAHKP